LFLNSDLQFLLAVKKLLLFFQEPKFFFPCFPEFFSRIFLRFLQELNLILEIATHIFPDITFQCFLHQDSFF
jgi:hypothetical protein